MLYQAIVTLQITPICSNKSGIDTPTFKIEHTYSAIRMSVQHGTTHELTNNHPSDRMWSANLLVSAELLSRRTGEPRELSLRWLPRWKPSMGFATNIGAYLHPCWRNQATFLAGCDSVFDLFVRFACPSHGQWENAQLLTCERHGRFWLKHIHSIQIR